jgi:hypothetical protein
VLNIDPLFLALAARWTRLRPSAQSAAQYGVTLLLKLVAAAQPAR